MRIDITPVANTSALSAKARRVGRNAVALSIGNVRVRLTADAVRKLGKLTDPPRCPSCGEPQCLDGDEPICTVCPLPFVLGPAVQTFRPTAA